MTTQLATQEPVQEKTLTADERLVQLAQRINEAHGRVPKALRYALICAYEAGQALLEAHDLCPKRKWLAWLRANFRFSRRTAARYVKFATECNRLGLNGTTLTQIPPNEASAVLKKLTVLPSGKKTVKATNGGSPLLPVRKAEQCQRARALQNQRIVLCRPSGTYMSGATPVCRVWA